MWVLDPPPLKELPSCCSHASSAQVLAQHLYTSVCFSLMLVHTHSGLYESRGKHEKNEHGKSVFMVDDPRGFFGNRLSILRDGF